jgi:hypothetical protein
VSNNGYLTFSNGQGTYTPTGLTGSYRGQPIIAPFYADVDTSRTGTVNYGTGTYNGFSAFGITWNGVGYFPSGTNKTNTFQVILVSRPDLAVGDFDIIFNYGSIQWKTAPRAAAATVSAERRPLPAMLLAPARRAPIISCQAPSYQGL